MYLLTLADTRAGEMMGNNDGVAITGQHVTTLEPEERVAELTAWLRTSPHPLFARLRTLLSEEGIDIQTALLAELFPTAAAREFGVVVTSKHRVFEFEFDYFEFGVEQGALSSLREVINPDGGLACAEGISAALRVPSMSRPLLT
jgi:hypothetical protein